MSKHTPTMEQLEELATTLIAKRRAFSALQQANTVHLTARELARLEINYANARDELVDASLAFEQARAALSKARAT